MLRGTHAETAIIVGSLVGESLELALKSKLLADKKSVNDGVFNGNGALATLQKRIDAAHDMNLIDDVNRKDAHLLRHIRNGFAHTNEKLNFDSGSTSALARQLSTYEAATSNQDAFLKAAGNVCKQAGKATRTFLQGPTQAEIKSR